MQKVIEAKMNLTLDAHKEQNMLSSLPKITENLRLLDDIVTNPTIELDVIYKQVAEEDLAEADVKKLLEDANRMVASTCETATELRARLRKAAATINKEESKKTTKRREREGIHGD